MSRIGALQRDLSVIRRKREEKWKMPNSVALLSVVCSMPYNHRPRDLWRSVGWIWSIIEVAQVLAREKVDESLRE